MLLALPLTASPACRGGDKTHNGHHIGPHKIHKWLPQFARAVTGPSVVIGRSAWHGMTWHPQHLTLLVLSRQSFCYSNMEPLYSQRDILQRGSQLHYTLHASFAKPTQLFIDPFVAYSTGPVSCLLAVLRQPAKIAQCNCKPAWIGSSSALFVRETAPQDFTWCLRSSMKNVGWIFWRWILFCSKCLQYLIAVCALCEGKILKELASIVYLQYPTVLYESCLENSVHGLQPAPP